jgi:quercetin dioxygenase-like cupin family protein
MVARTHRVVQHKSAIPGVEGMTLFSDHAFPRHSHDQFGIGIMTSGAQRSWSVIGQVESQAGDVIMVNPGEMHDGVPVSGFARGWRILYLDPDVVGRETAGEVPDDTQIPPVAVIPSSGNLCAGCSPAQRIRRPTASRPRRACCVA